MFSINNQEIKSIESLVQLPRETEYEIDIYTFLNEWYNNKETVTTKTSGSTGKPKEIKLTKKAMLKSAQLTCSFFNLKAKQTALLCLPTKYIAGKLMLVRSIYADLSLISVPPSRNPLKKINTPIHFAAMTPMQVVTILKENPEKINLISILIIGGAAVEPFLERQLSQFDTKCYSTFGMTETITHIALRELNKDNHFIALPSISFNKTKENCLTIHAPHISSNPLITNDKIDLLSSTSFKWLGRKDNVINSGGIKIQAEVLEKKIASIIPNNRFFITTEKDELLGKKIILIIENKSPLELNELDFSLLEKYENPKKIYSLPQFKETETGKIMRKENELLVGINQT